MSDLSQFLKWVQRNTELDFDAIKGLVKQNFQLLRATTDLEATQQKLRKLEKKISISSMQGQSQVDETLNKLTEALSKLLPMSANPLENHDVAIFNGDEQKYSVWKSSVQMKLM